MINSRPSIEHLLDSLRERAKELNCLYAVEEILRRPNANQAEICRAVVATIPTGLQYPEICRARIVIDHQEYGGDDFSEGPWVQEAAIVVNDAPAGKLQVYYTRRAPTADLGPFFKEEIKLIITVADRLGHFFTYQQMRKMAQGVETARQDLLKHAASEWRVVLDLLRQTDQDLFRRISHKMLNHLCWSGIPAAQQLSIRSRPGEASESEAASEEPNRPQRWTAQAYSGDTSEETFDIAGQHLSDDDILARIQEWIQEEKLGFLSLVVNRHVTLPIVADAIRRYHLLSAKRVEMRSPAKRGVEVALIRRFLSDQLDYINIAKNFINLDDFYDLLQNLIYSADSHGRLGGKSAGVYLAMHILKKANDPEGLLSKIRTPKTWYITSDVILHFMHYNDLDNVVEQKYKEIDQIRQEYPHVVQMFKGSRFPPDIVKSLSVALDSFGDRPLIVRSSSLLEDRMGAAFSGKYRSLFLANQGTKEQRLAALTDAIAEVYASTFAPDPIEYRTERGLIDFGEEMGVMIQEVVGTRVGDYFLPSFAGVGLSRNELRWSPRIKRDDGLLRIVPGLGTRAVDRLSDDYPVLVAPGQPTLRVNATVDEVLRYAPRKIDVINLKTNTFETIAVSDLVKKYGPAIPGLQNIVSVLVEGGMLRPLRLEVPHEKNDLVVTFQGLISDTPFVRMARVILRTLEERLQIPVDIEFASDGQHFYLLQCRPQTPAPAYRPAPIPKDVPRERIVFTANRHVSNGHMSDITHIVYIDPQRYTELPDRADLLAVGRAVGRLNELLPKRQFILVGPGRWGSRGDIKLGVSVTYSDINNTGALIEVARQRGNYVPDLSFGTHFFQDLVEGSIHYLPLYPDDAGILFNEKFLKESPNILPEILPEYAYLADTIRLIDVPSAANGKILRLLMNADLDEALAMLAEPKSAVEPPVVPQQSGENHSDNYWRWRWRMCEQIASQLDPDRFGVVGFYVFGSTKNATAGPASDIDLLLHIRSTDAQRAQLECWLNGWSLCLDEINYLQTGYRSGGLLDVHLVTDDDIANRSSFASKIGAVTDPARPLPIGKPETSSTEALAPPRPDRSTQT